MTDDVTPETPPEETPGQEPEPVEPSVEEPILEEPQLDEPEAQQPEESIEDIIMHRFQSWQGRRDAELREEFQRQQQALLERISQQQPAAAQERVPDPSEDADAWFEYKARKIEQSKQDFYTKARRTAAEIITSDPLTAQDPRIGEEIAAQILSGATPLDINLPPQVAAENAVIRAKSNVLTNRMLNRPNPLEKNSPSAVPKGGVRPPAARTKATPKIGKVSDLTMQKAKQWGYSPEDLARVFGKA